MPAEVILKIKKGSLKGTEFSYNTRESFVIGRDADCPVCFSEDTVSRYHCHIDINPPDVMIRDFKSLNGTMLNGKLIGQRDPSLSLEEAQEPTSDGIPLKSGDRLGLGKDCEIEIIVKESAVCVSCHCELDESKSKNKSGQLICKNCYEKQEKQRRIDEIRKIKEKEQNKGKPEDGSAKDGELIIQVQPKVQSQNGTCYICENVLDEDTNGTNICSKCRKNPVNILQFLLNLAIQDKKGDEVNIAGFRNIKLLGEGGMGQVWLVENERTSEKMAFKIMLPNYAQDERSIKVFLRESYTGCALKNVNIVEHFKFGRSGCIFFILMEFCKGGSVDKLLEKKGGSLGRNEQDMAIATSIMFQVLDGLYFTHNALIPVVLAKNETEKRKGVVHRDFKPANIFIANTDFSRPIAKVADFGLAKAFDAAGLTSISRGGGTCGTIVYMPRQQLRDSRYAKPDVDVWAAAASYYNMMTGELVRDFKGRSSGELYWEVINKPTIPIRERNFLIPEQLAQVIDTVLQEEPEIGIHKIIKEMYGEEPKEHVEALVLKKKIWESLTLDFRKKVWDILPDVNKNNLSL